MIRHRWDDVIASDRALHRGEWAGVRVSTAAERKVISAGRRDVCNTFLFQGCGHVLRLIVTNNVPQPGFVHRMGMEAGIRSTIAKRATTVEQPYSSAVFAVVLALAPVAVVDLERVQRMRCDSCSCVFRSGGAIEADSEQRVYARREVMESKFIQRSAAR